MSGLFQNANAGVWAKLLGPFFASGIFGGLIIWIGASWHSEFAKSLGDAFVVAGIIGLCLEIFAASRIIEHASQSVAEKMTGYGLPEPARAVIYSLVHHTKRVYRDYRRIYRIERHRDKSGYVLVHNTISYRVVNNGKANDAYQPTLEESVIYNPTFESLQFGDKVFTPQTIRQDTIKTTITFSPDQTIQISGSAANTPAELLRPDQQCQVRWAYTMEMPEMYSDVTAYAGMTIHPVIELIEKPYDLDFWASETSCCKHVGNVWTYEEAFVAGQHLRTWWRPRSSVV